MSVRAAQVSTVIDAPADVVWEGLTNVKTLGHAFFGSSVSTDWKPGSPITFRGEWKGKRFEDKGQIQVFRPPEQLRFTHWSGLSGVPDTPENYHLVTFDLRRVGRTTRVMVTQDNEDDQPVGVAAQQEFGENWTAILDRLRGVVEGGPQRRGEATPNP